MGIVVRGRFCRKSGPTIKDSIVSECLQLDLLVAALDPKREYPYHGWEAFRRNFESVDHSAFRSYPATGTESRATNRSAMRDIAAR